MQNLYTKSCLTTKNGSVVRMSENPLLSKMQNRGGSIPKADRKEAREFGREIAQNGPLSVVGGQHPANQIMQGKLKPNVSRDSRRCASTTLLLRISKNEDFFELYECIYMQALTNSDCPMSTVGKEEQCDNVPHHEHGRQTSEHLSLNDFAGPSTDPQAPERLKLEQAPALIPAVQPNQEDHHEEQVFRESGIACCSAHEQSRQQPEHQAEPNDPVEEGRGCGQVCHATKYQKRLVWIRL